MKFGFSRFGKRRRHGALKRKDRFGRFARMAAHASGSPIACGLAVSTVVVWALTGPYFHYSDTWQLVINTGTTVITFLMVFLIQNTQNRDSEAIQLKLDELIRATESAHNALLNIEELSDAELLQIQVRFRALAAKARRELQQGKSDLGVSEADLHEAATDVEAEVNRREKSTSESAGQPEPTVDSEMGALAGRPARWLSRKKSRSTHKS